MRIAWRKQAQDDLNRIFDYFLQFDPGAAIRLFETIRSRVELLADHPGIGRPGRVEDTRELVITRTNYLVAYTVDRRIDAVVILCVLHGRQTWPESFDDDVS